MIRAIPGQFGRSLFPPPGRVSAALDAIERLAADVERRELYAFLAPRRIQCHWCAVEDHGELSVHINDAFAWALGESQHRAINWRWTVLWESADWYEVGWLPCSTYFGLARSWQERLRLALNPGKQVHW